MIDNKLAIAGELTWQEVVESVEGFLRGPGGCASPLSEGKPRKRLWVEILFFWGACRLRSLLGLP